MEVWLRPNVRILYTGCMAGAAAATGGVLLLVVSAIAGGVFISAQPGVVWIVAAVVGAAVLLGGVALAAVCAHRARTARMGYEDQHLVLNLGARQPFRIPLDLVEVFFLGQAGSGVPDKSETTTVVVRLAERAEDWKKRDAHPRICRWCDGYITLLGAWTEPVDAGVVNALNQKLLARHREQKAQQQAEAAAQVDPAEADTGQQAGNSV